MLTTQNLISAHVMLKYEKAEERAVFAKYKIHLDAVPRRRNCNATTWRNLFT